MSTQTIQRQNGVQTSDLPKLLKAIAANGAEHLMALHRAKKLDEEADAGLDPVTMCVHCCVKPTWDDGTVYCKECEPEVEKPSDDPHEDRLLAEADRMLDLILRK